ncbi:hypothetical protein FTO74_13235 [Granulicella sp. WH15]|uniref:PD-(D/E)XK nuclease family protein n=1 Tax=Granulicella sp. WH15 TaxID=2602070 RepID=UPI001366F97B|nr:PD-(D/E)XK nuclease family protein [Granulicella sp. WH15]QHN04218.1 hypothetical protein FTO74_13235 [Granulicella sp. WH15]
MPLPPEIAQALADGGEIVTSNQRAARTLRRDFNAAMQAEGRTRWHSPSIFAFDTWATGLWHQILLAGKTDRVLLNPAQEHAIWRAVLAAESSSETTRSLDSLAQMAAEAWSRLHLYNGRSRLRTLSTSTDTRAFQRWAVAFERRLQRESWLTRAELPAALGAAGLAINGLLLVGFDTPPPAYTSLFASLTPVTHYQPATEAHDRQLAACADDLSEIRAAAHWARSVLTAAPAARIGVIVPGLEDRKPLIARVFREILAPELEDIASTAAAPYEFSLGTPLASTALVATALDLLRWTQQPLPLDTISALLLSPYFGAALGDEAAAAAAEFDAFELRQSRMLRPELTLDQAIASVATAKRSEQLTDLLLRLRALRRSAADTTERPYAEHADAFRAALEATRWSVRAGEDSTTFQALRRWESALDELATLDFDGSRATPTMALRALTRIATQAIFAPESHDAPIQILGPLEASGSRFDAAWVLGAGELSWPPQPSTTPFLPWHIQQELAMPGADAARDRGAAQRLTARLASAAPTVVFSYSATLADGHQHPSPLLEPLGLTPYDPIPEPTRTALPLESVPDQPPPPYPPDHPSRGGSQLLQHQAACAFRAFAEHRLGSSAIDARDPGMNALERGVDVHKIMETFWDEVRDQETLKSLTENQRHATLDRCIDAALGRSRRLTQTTWDEAYLSLQRERLRQLLRPWLDFELTRPPFLVRQQEEKLEAHIGPLHLQLRADRIDETSGGDLILDYKTGHASPAEWLSDRPDAPQLPLYAIQPAWPRPDGTPLGGVAFALLRAGDDLALTGFASTPEVFASTAKNQLPLESQLEEWRRVLTALAEEFAAGDARVDPKRYPNTCQHCGQRLLCRLNLATFSEEESEESELAHE